MHTPITKVPDQRRDSGPSFPFSVASSDLASGKLVLGAQTTPFSYPESCKGTMGVIRDSDHHVETPVWGVGCNVPPDKPGDQIPFPWDCFPPHFAQVRTYASFDDSRIANVGPLYSPGLACPSDWNPVRMLTRTDGPIPTDWVDNDDLWDVLQAGETYVNCCPSGYSWILSAHNLQHVHCVSTINTKTKATVASFGSSCSRTVATVTPRSHSATGYAIHGANVNMIVPSGMKFGQTVPASSGTPSTSSSASSGAAAATSGGANNGTSNEQPSGRKGGISTNAKIAIGVVIPIVFVGALIIAAFLIRRYRRKSHASSVNGKPTHPDAPEAGGSEKAEVDGIDNQRNELAPSAERVPELDDKSLPNELASVPFALPELESGKGFDKESGLYELPANATYSPGQHDHEPVSALSPQSAADPYNPIKRKEVPANGNTVISPVDTVLSPTSANKKNLVNS